MRYINRLFTYLLTYLLTVQQSPINCSRPKTNCKNERREKVSIEQAEMWLTA